jgi:membrane-bound metal-dependent hydrolase YbcI (DUF457 family)
MTFVAHSIVGLTVATIIMPKTFKVYQKSLLFVIFVAFANLPDLTRPGYGHELYYLSHSIFVNLILLLIVVMPFLLSEKLRNRIGGFPVLIGCAICWLSHLLLDSMYNHGQGIAMFWPFSDARLALPVPFFETLKGGDTYFSSHSIKVFLIEIAFYGSFFAIAQLLIYLKNNMKTKV